MNLKDKILDKAQKFVQKGQFDKAIAEYRNAIDMDPKDVSVRLRAGDLYVKVGKKAEAVREYTEAAKIHGQKGFYLKAIAVYKQVLKLDDSNIDVHNRLAELYAKQRLVADAVSEYNYIVNILEKKGRSGDVAELLRKMVDIDPENVGVRLKLAETYQRQRFDKDALIEYSGVLEKLLAQRKADKAEKIYLQLFAHYGKTPSVLKGLSDVYLAKKDGVQFLKYAKPLLGIYAEERRIEEGRALCKAILSVKPGDIESESFLDRFREPEKVAPAAEAVTVEAPSAAPGVEVHEAAPPAPTAIPPVPPAPKGEPVERIEPVRPGPESKKPAVPPPPPQPVVSAPESVEEAGEGEIDITIEGFEEEPLKIEAARPAAPKEAAETPQAEEVREEAPPAPAPPVPAITAEPSYPLHEEAEPEAREEIKAEPEKAPVEITEEAEEEEKGYSKRLEETLKEAEDFIKQFRETRPTTPAQAPPPPPSHVEAAREEERAPEVVEIIHFEEAVRPPEAHPEEARVEEVTEVEVLKAETPREAPRERPTKESALISEEAISEAIDEIMEREAPPPPPAPARHAPLPETEEIFTPPAGLIESAPAEEAPHKEFTETFVQEKAGELGITKEEYVDLSAELGIGATEVETINEFKTGIEKQLGREDTETHYNLGIAYMEMELYKDAEKEFKIALKDPHREFDCFTRLGHCAMAEKTPDEAVVYFQKAMKTGGRSDEERKGVMYELALAYEAANNPGEALPLFKSVYAMDPDFREAALKVRKVKAPTAAAAAVGVKEVAPAIPIDDSLIEVELL